MLVWDWNAGFGDSGFGDRAFSRLVLDPGNDPSLLISTQRGASLS